MKERGRQARVTGLVQDQGRDASGGLSSGPVRPQLPGEWRRDFLRNREQRAAQAVPLSQRSQPAAQPGGRPGDWTCPSCGAHVFGSKDKCYKCQTPRSLSASRHGSGTSNFAAHAVRFDRDGGSGDGHVDWRGDELGAADVETYGAAKASVERAAVGDVADLERLGDLESRDYLSCILGSYVAALRCSDHGGVEAYVEDNWYDVTSFLRDDDCEDQAVEDLHLQAASAMVGHEVRDRESDHGDDLSEVRLTLERLANVCDLDVRWSVSDPDVAVVVDSAGHEVEVGEWMCAHGVEVPGQDEEWGARSASVAEEGDVYYYARVARVKGHGWDASAAPADGVAAAGEGSWDDSPYAVSEAAEVAAMSRNWWGNAMPGSGEDKISATFPLCS